MRSQGDRRREEDLRAARELVQRRKEAMREAVRACQAERKTVQQRMKDARREMMQQVRSTIGKAKLSAHEACTLRKTGARSKGHFRTERAKEELRKEKQFQNEIRRAEGRLRRREASRATAAERRQESDDEVRGNLELELVPLFDQVRRTIKGSPYQSRTEAFLKWAEENPDAVLQAQEQLAEREIRKLLREQQELGHQMKRARRRPKPTPEELANIPF